jgi:hypothetical protein
MPRKDENPLDSDGLIAPLVGRWSAEKYGLISYCAKIFSGGMKSTIWHLHILRFERRKTCGTENPYVRKVSERETGIYPWGCANLNRENIRSYS